MKQGFENEVFLWYFWDAYFKVKVWEDFPQNICRLAHVFLWVTISILVYLSKGFVHLVVKLMFLVGGELLDSIWKVPGWSPHTVKLCGSSLGTIICPRIFVFYKTFLFHMLHILLRSHTTQYFGSARAFSWDKMKTSFPFFFSFFFFFL